MCTELDLNVSTLSILENNLWVFEFIIFYGSFFYQ